MIENWLKASAQADDEAHESTLAWLVGPDEYIAHITRKAEAIRKRIEDEYAATADRTGQPTGEAHPATSGSVGGRT